ncbi:hypothetical protein DY000_02062734 [Brassica cretica]|uniref:Uncharacterized protein n=1 Tax=Brassica cretica TaxID=69181 RepID=A0ABQ7AY51_BRACR|nr:hypothetical protein DY000_02062734 [Brassica cretica]
MRRSRRGERQSDEERSTSLLSRIETERRGEIIKRRDGLREDDAEESSRMETERQGQILTREIG